ncbi:MAG: hypothetical protein OHK0053_22340 [Microscillaceae bacterium]
MMQLRFFILFLVLGLGLVFSVEAGVPSIDQKVAKKMERAERFLNSRLGQWLVKKMAIKAENKKFRQQYRALKGQTEAQAQLKANHQAEVDKIKALNSDVRLGIIIGAIGLIVIIIAGAVGSSLLGALGAIALVVGLVFIILGVA